MSTTVSLAARAVSPRPRNAANSPLTAATFGKLPGIRSRRAGGARPNFVAQGFTVTVRADQTLAIESPTGCNLQVLDGHAWVTAEGAPLDVFAAASANVPLACGVRFVVSGLHDAVTIAVTLPEDVLDARFALHVENGLRILRVTAGGGIVESLAARGRAWLGTLERQLLAPRPRHPARFAR